MTQNVKTLIIRNNGTGIAESNRLIYAPELVFLTHLRHFKCENCNITQATMKNYLSFEQLSNLYSLALPKNGIESIAELIRDNRAYNMPLTYLLSLDLSHNLVKWIPNNMYMMMPHLKSLNLAHNRIHRVDMKLHLAGSVTHLDLSYNEMWTISEDWNSISKRPEFQIKLGGNPWECNCKLKGLSMMVTDSTKWSNFYVNEIYHNLKCASPFSVAGKLIKDLSGYWDKIKCH